MAGLITGAIKPMKIAQGSTQDPSLQALQNNMADQQSALGSKPAGGSATANGQDMSAFGSPGGSNSTVVTGNAASSSPALTGNFLGYHDTSGDPSPSSGPFAKPAVDPLYANGVVVAQPTPTTPALNHSGGGTTPDVNTLIGGPSSASTGNSSNTGNSSGAGNSSGGGSFTGTTQPLPTTPSTASAGSGSTQAWTPTAGITGDLRQVTPQNVTATGYDTATVDPTQQATATGYNAATYQAQKAPDAVGYDAKGYDANTYTAQQGTAETQGENVSQAIGRIIDQDSPLMQRARAQADEQSNSRGLLNSSMAVGAAQGALLDRAQSIGQGDVQTGEFNVAQKNTMTQMNVQQMNDSLRFNADAKNQASAFLANAQNQAAQFLAAAKNQNGMFNAEQANNAAAFSAQAQNQASQFAAAAQNLASQFNAQQTNQRSLFVADAANQAARFAADAQNAAASQNAAAYNQAMTNYVNAFNSALAAHDDAMNLASRDTAQINAQTNIAQIGANATVAAANAHAAGQVGAAQAMANASMANAQLAASTSRQNTIDSINGELQRTGMQINAQQQLQLDQLNASEFNQFTTGLNGLMTTGMPPGDRQNAIHNWMSVWSGSSYLPFNINMDNFPAAGG